METLNRLLINIVSQQLEGSTKFYTELFDFRVDYESDWFVHLISEKNNLELGIITPTSEVTPKGLGDTSNGFYLTFVVDNVDEIYKKATTAELTIIEKPKDTFYGQRRLLLKDPNGVILDVSSPVA